MTLLSDLRRLISEPKLRRELGERGPVYVRKYHSMRTAQLMFGRIYDKIWFEKDVDLMNYFHPLIGQYDQDYADSIKKSSQGSPREKESVTVS